MGFEASHLKHGFSDWVKQGGPTEQLGISPYQQLPFHPLNLRTSLNMHKIDHFAIGATSDAGVDALEPTLGVRVPDGGKHTLMSTHNCVMQSGNETFLS